MSQQKNNSIQYPYSKIYSVAISITFSICLGIAIKFLIECIRNNDILGISVATVMNLFFLSALTFIVIKYLLPAIKGKIALELNNEGLVSYVKNVVVPWNAISDMEYSIGKSTSSIYIYFKWETDQGSQIRIQLQWIKGNEGKIYDTVRSYFERLG